MIVNKKKRICRIVGFAILVDHGIKLKENEKRKKYLDHAKELKKLWNMKVTMRPIVIGVFGTVTKGFIKGLEELEIFTLLKSARLLKRVQKICRD